MNLPPFVLGGVFFWGGLREHPSLVVFWLFFNWICVSITSPTGDRGSFLCLGWILAVGAAFAFALQQLGESPGTTWAVRVGDLAKWGCESMKFRQDLYTRCWQILKHCHMPSLRGGFKHFPCSRLLGEMVQFVSYFSNGLKPTTWNSIFQKIPNKNRMVETAIEFVNTSPLPQRFDGTHVQRRGVN